MACGDKSVRAAFAVFPFLSNFCSVDKVSNVQLDDIPVNILRWIRASNNLPSILIILDEKGDELIRTNSRWQRRTDCAWYNPISYLSGGHRFQTPKELIDQLADGKLAYQVLFLWTDENDKSPRVTLYRSPKTSNILSEVERLVKEKVEIEKKTLTEEMKVYEKKVEEINGKVNNPPVTAVSSIAS